MKVAIVITISATLLCGCSMQKINRLDNDSAASSAVAARYDNLLDEMQEELQQAKSEEFREVNDMEATAEELLSTMEKFHKRPINLNNTNATTLKELGLLTDFQIAALLEYVDKHGAILSYAELSLLHGFSEEIVTALRPYTQLGEAAIKRQGFFKELNTTLFARYGQTASLPLKSRDDITATRQVRYRSSYSDLADIALLCNQYPNGKDKLFYSLKINNINLNKKGSFAIRSIALGDISAKFAQGILLWNGLTFNGSEENNGFVKRGDEIALYTSSDTTKRLTGAAVKIAAAAAELTALYSFNRQLAAMRLTYLFSHLKIGINLSNNLLNKELICSSDIYTSIGGVLIFAEGAYSKKGIAALAGLSIPKLNIGAKEWAINALARSYGKEFNSPYGGSYSTITKIQNQRGISARIKGPLYKRIKLSLGADYTAYPAPRYRVKGPSSTTKAYLKLNWNDSKFFASPKNEIWTKLSLKRDVEYFGTKSATTLCIIKGYGKLYLSRGITLFSRYELNSSGGKAISANMSLRAAAGLVTAYTGAILYDAQSWSGRIYFYEHDLPFSYSTHLLYGKGIDSYAAINAKLSRWLSLHLKFQQRSTKLQFKVGAKLEL